MQLLCLGFIIDIGENVRKEENEGGSLKICIFETRKGVREKDEYHCDLCRPSWGSQLSLKITIFLSDSPIMIKQQKERTDLQMISHFCSITYLGGH